MNARLSAIVAVCDDWGIGLDGGMIVENRADMRHFVRHTTGHAVIMGRKTLESFPGGRPLKDRRNIVLTRDPAFARTGVEVAHSVDEALDMLADGEEAWVIGGAEVYRQLLPHCGRAVVTKNHCVRPADAFFPNLDEDGSWAVASVDGPYTIEAGQGEEGLSYDFVTYERAPRDGDGAEGKSGSSWTDVALDVGTSVVNTVLDIISG